ncbi:MAG: hypothetical protein GY862_20535 [Gammaproteobacteria bacterium]|nr:hypothetical protein [Gammaproteobacteria bacterium]
MASVLMHAWAEVEHDLVYKPFQGVLSEDEYAILDGLNGMVISGEIALERLQRAAELRVTSKDRRFSNHFDLAGHILSVFPRKIRIDVIQAGLGRTDILFDFLNKLKLATPEAIASHIDELHSNFEQRPISDQISDLLMAEDVKRYKVYEAVLNAHSVSHGPKLDEDPPLSGELHEAIGQFLSAWVKVERFIRERTQQVLGDNRHTMPTLKVVDKVAPLDKENRMVLYRLLKLRNCLVHGVEVPEESVLREAADELGSLLETLKQMNSTDAARYGGQNAVH